MDDTESEKKPLGLEYLTLEALVNSSGCTRLGLDMRSQRQKRNQGGKFTMRNLTPGEDHQLRKGAGAVFPQNKNLSSSTVRSFHLTQDNTPTHAPIHTTPD